MISRLIRLEYSDNKDFNDNATLIFLNRNLPSPVFTSDTSENTLTIKTTYLFLQYNATGPFTSDNLQITLSIDGNQVVWYPGLVDSGNLLGTVHTLDDVNGSVSLNCSQYAANSTMFCAYGIVSRGGWTVGKNFPRIF
jgi:hypothetical protein